MMEVMEKIEQRFVPDVPIFTRDILALADGIPRSTVYYQIDKAVEAGRLAKGGRGVYYLPTRTVLGESVLPSLSPLVKSYIADGEDVYGYWGGLMLENQEGLTTQNPTVLEIVTNKATKRLVKLGAQAGYKDVVLRPPRVEVTSDNVEVLKFLDLVTEVSDLGDEDTGKWIAAKASSLDADEVLSALRCYPAKTSKKLVESGVLGVSISCASCAVWESLSRGS